MLLTLAVLRAPAGVAPQTRQVGGGSFSIGRGPDNDWVLPDPDRHLSKRHCMLECRGGQWQVADLSTNGTTVNGEPEPLGSTGPRALRDGDRLRLGSYEIEVRMEAAGAGYGSPGGAAFDPFADAAPRGGHSGGAATLDPFAAPFGGASRAAASFLDDPIGPADPLGRPGGTPSDGALPGFGGSSVRLGAEFDPLGSDRPDPYLGQPTQPDHTPAVNDAYRPPPVVAALPDDWDLDLTPAQSFEPPPPRPATAFAPPALSPGLPTAPALPASVAAPALPASVAAPALPASVAAPAQPLVPATPRSGPRPLPPPAPTRSHLQRPDVARPGASGERAAFDPGDDAFAATPAASPGQASAGVAPPAGWSGAGAAAVPAGAPGTELLEAFLLGAGLSGARLAEPEAAMHALGEAFRAMVGGLRQAMIARAAIKGEFRIEQTMVRARGNNPLKFSADDDDALAALIGTGRRTGMAPADAVADALRDMRLHELAAMAAMQAAVRALMEQLDPAPLRREAEASGGLAVMPAQRRARAFEAYEALHARISRALADDFDSVFGKAFARAYEQALREAQSREDLSREDRSREDGPRADERYEDPPREVRPRGTGRDAMRGGGR